MKRYILAEILRSLSSQPQLKRKLKAFAVVGGVAVVLGSVLMIWLAVSVFGLISSQVQNIASINLSQPLPQVHQVASGFMSEACLRESQSLMNLQSWLTEPLGMKFSELKTACWDTASAQCKGENCPPAPPVEKGWDEQSI